MGARGLSNAPPPARRGEQVQSPTLPLPPPRDAATTEAFLTWVATRPRDHAKDVREAIAAIRERSAVAAVLNEQLLRLPCADVGRHLLLLSTIGELRDPSSLAALERFAWLPDEQIFAAPPTTERTCSFTTGGMLQARAAEMLAWILQGRNDESVLRLIRDHPSRAVRIAAIDAYLFQRGDAPEAVEFLRGQVGAADRSMVGLPRFGADADPETFDRLTAEFEAAHPSDAPRPWRREPTISPFWLGFCAGSGFGLGLLLALKATRISTGKRGTPYVR